MHKWITFPHREGTCSRQAHADFPEQAIYEREAGRSGFWPRSAFSSSTCTDRLERVGRRTASTRLQLQSCGGSECFVSLASALLLHNHEVKVRVWKLEQAMPALARNADGDELLFIHQGKADLYCDYGHMVVSEGDYALIRARPTGV